MLHDEEGGAQPERWVPGAEEVADVLPDEVPGEGIGDDRLHRRADLDPEAMRRGVVDEWQPPPVRIAPDAQFSRRPDAEVLEALAPQLRDQDESDVDARLVVDLLEEDLEMALVTLRQDAGVVPDAVLEQGREGVADLRRPPGGGADHQERDGQDRGDEQEGPPPVLRCGQDPHDARAAPRTGGGCFP
jgi:hypothetical protein